VVSDMSAQTRSAQRLKDGGVVGQRFFYGWWVVATCAVGLFWGPPVTVFSFPIFLKPLMQEFHAGRAAVSLALTLNLVISALTAPLTGWLVGRYGARRVMLPAAAIFGALLLSTRLFSTTLWHFYVFYAALGVVAHGLGPIPCGYVVSHWFDRRRGLALGLMMIGLGLGAMIMPSFAQQLIVTHGWRAAYSILGSAVLLVVFPVVAVLLKENPHDLGLLPDGKSPKKSTALGVVVVSGLSARDAWHSGTFWLMVSTFFFVSASAQGCVIHLAAMLTDRGITAQTAALGSSVVGAALLIGRVGTGYLLDHLFAPRIAAVIFGGSALGICLLWWGTAPFAFAGGFLVGLGLGAEVDLIAYLTSRYFGLRAFGEIYSSLFSAFALAAAFGPLIMGKSFDLTGSYRTPLAAFLVATLLAAGFMTRLGPYRYCTTAPT
jgi:MFS family permease